jgi:4-amino-4-deoxy-L-arabinose transferase-like glycosyltransferase
MFSFRRRAWLIIGLLLFSAFYALTRLPNLTKLPIFTDEAIYIRWSQIGAQDANWRFISLTDGKQPMFTWIMMGLLKVVHADPLFDGRLTSVLAGFATMWGVWLLAWELFRSRKVSWAAAALYLILPFTLWYDRMALYDSLVAAFSVWNLYLSIRLVRTLRTDIALVLALTLGAGMLNKSSGFLSMYLLPFTLILFDWKSPKRRERLLRWVGLAATAAALSQVYYSILRLSPFFHMIAQKDNVFLFSFREWMNQPFRFLVGNLRGMFDWLRSYLTLPLFIVAFIPLFTRWPHTKERLLLYIWWLLPFVALANFAKILYPRFILFMAMPLLLVAAQSMTSMWDSLRRPFARIILVAIVVIPLLMISVPIVLDPVHAPIPAPDRGQYIDDWPAGGGVPQVVRYLKEQVAMGKVNVYTEGTFGLMPASIEIYLVNNPNILIKGIWPLTEAFPDEIKAAALAAPTYIILNESQTPPHNWPLKLIGEYLKGTRPDKKMRFYQVDLSLSRSL